MADNNTENDNAPGDTTPTLLTIIAEVDDLGDEHRWLFDSMGKDKPIHGLSVHMMSRGDMLKIATELRGNIKWLHDVSEQAFELSQAWP